MNITDDYRTRTEAEWEKHISIPEWARAEHYEIVVPLSRIWKFGKEPADAKAVGKREKKLSFFPYSRRKP